MLAPGALARRRSVRSGRQDFPAPGARQGRVALLAGCVNDVLAPQINAAAIRVLTRHGVEVVLAEGEGCCGSLVHHMGREDEALRRRARNIDAWTREIEGDGLDAILITASGCGTTVKDYGFMLRTDPAYAERAARSPAWPKTSANISPRCRSSRAQNGRSSPSPITRPARCSTASESRGSRRIAGKAGLRSEGRATGTSRSAYTTWPYCWKWRSMPPCSAL